MKKLTIALDLDGVFADFFPFAAARFGRDYRSADPEKFWAWASSVPNLFSHLEPIGESLPLWEALRDSGHDLYVLTAIPRPTGLLATAPDDKRAWVARYLSPDLRVETVLGGANKGLWAQPGHILIDDTERNVMAWQDNGGIGIWHANPAQTIEALRELGALPRPAAPSLPSSR